jgi:hypothetical protein
VIFEGIGTFDAASVLRFDPSARSRALGGASGAVFWGDLDGWTNPAVLGLASGLGYEDERTSLGLEYRARRTVLGWGGLGVALAGRPFAGMGGLRVSDRVTIDVLGSPSVISLDQQVKSWSVGASLSELATSIARMRGDEAPTFTRLADIALGFSHRSLRENFFGFPVDASPAMDWGLLIRTGSPFTAFANHCRADLAYGYSVQNANKVAVSGSLGSLGTVWRPHRHGTAARLSLDPPALSDRVFVTSEGRRVGDETRLGAEIGLANVAFLRFGEGPDRSVHASGYGFALPIARFVRVRYDHARSTDGWSVWLDPFASTGTRGRAGE